MDQRKLLRAQCDSGQALDRTVWSDGGHLPWRIRPPIQSRFQAGWLQQQRPT